jgi:hypothetical protein
MVVFVVLYDEISENGIDLLFKAALNANGSLSSSTILYEPFID